MIIDLDHFKAVNDLYGHVAGDKALLNAARIIKSCIGGRGLLGRIGGDEFFALIPDYSGDINELRSLLRSIRTHIKWHFSHIIWREISVRMTQVCRKILISADCCMIWVN